jgi:hypothetical protein
MVDRLFSASLMIGSLTDYAFFYTAFGKSDPSRAAMAQFVGFRFQVSGFGCSAGGGSTPPLTASAESNQMRNSSMTNVD